MSTSGQKLTPAEFLAELKSDPAPESTSATAQVASLDDLDFSDLEPPAPSAESKAPAAAQSDDQPAGPRQTPSAPSPADKPPQQADTPPAPQTGAPKKSSVTVAGNRPGFLKRNSQLSDLFDRVNNLLGSSAGQADEKFRPLAPESLEQTRLTGEEIERLILKVLLSKGSATGRGIASQIKLPFNLIDPLLKRLKQEQSLAFKGAAQMGDYDFVITDQGRERAKQYAEECTYFGAAPVSLADYLNAMAAQSIAKQEATEADLKRAFSDLLISPKMLERLGPAVNSGRGMFLFGEPGNGKTSIAERITRSFGSTIWIPRALGIDGDIIRLFDPGVHEEVQDDSEQGIFDLSGVDQRWVQIVRPTVVAGGELTMEELEVVQNTQTKICEAPLQLKSNCGTLVIDDFGRQTMPVDVLLNRWIVPLEKRYDFLNLPSGKKVQVPFDQLIIFSTNLEPKDLVDGAFLRRIPYKIEVPDPSEEDFRALCKIMAPKMGFEFDKRAIDYLVEKHYLQAKRPFRACQPRDLLLQVRNYCVYKGLPKKLTEQAFDFAAENYFSVM